MGCGSMKRHRERYVSSAVRLFDTHCHIFKNGFTGETGVRFPNPDEELAAYEVGRAKLGIERSLVVGYDESDYLGNSDYIASLGRTREWLLPLRYASIGAEISPLASSYPVTTEKAEVLAEQLRKQALAGQAPRILSLNATPEALQVLRGCMELLPDTWFLISHMGLPGPVTTREHAREVLRAVVAAAALPNVSVKLSGQYAATSGAHPHLDVQPLVQELAERAGIESLVWGSDFSPALDFVSFEQARDCILPDGITSDERHSIYFQNAADMYDRFGGVIA